MISNTNQVAPILNPLKSRLIVAKALFLLMVSISILFIMPTNSAYAQNKVVVVPLGGGDVNKPDLVPLRVWRGSVSADGSKRGTGRFTTTKQGVGRYSISVDLDIPGLDTSSSNITGFGIPVASIYFGSAGDAIRVSGASKSSTSGQVIALRFNIATANASNVATDKAFHFHFMLDEPNGPSASSSSAISPSSASLSTKSDPEVKCTTQGDTETCTIGEVF